MRRRTLSASSDGAERNRSASVAGKKKDDKDDKKKPKRLHAKVKSEDAPLPENIDKRRSFKLSKESEALRKDMCVAFLLSLS